MKTRETTTLYKKVGKRYVKHDDYLDDKGLPEGLYLFYKNGNAMMSMLHYAKVHDIQNVGRFCDIFVAHQAKISDAVEKALEKGGFSVNDLTKKIIDQHKGSVYLKEPKEKGCTFIIKLPLV